VPELAEELQGVGAGGMLAECADIARHRFREVLRELYAVLGRHDDRGREAGEREVRRAEAVAEE
jgi:hypothetical protein